MSDDRQADTDDAGGGRDVGQGYPEEQPGGSQPGGDEDRGAGDHEGTPSTSETESGPDTATASFSIVIGDQPEMDFGGRRNADGQGFAVFGRVTRGMDVVKAIQASPTGSEGPYGTESLVPPIRILKAFRKQR